jgi:hypothetical protein
MRRASIVRLQIPKLRVVACRAIDPSQDMNADGMLWFFLILAAGLPALIFIYRVQKKEEEDRNEKLWTSPSNHPCMSYEQGLENDLCENCGQVWRDHKF